MKISAFLLLLTLISCAHDPRVASDSMAGGNVKVSAVKMYRPGEVCFDITINLNGVDQKAAESSNWSLAWVDQNSRYHLLSMTLRDPASIPQGAHSRWKNYFRTCAAKASLNDVKSLILTPKELPFRGTQGLKLEWK